MTGYDSWNYDRTLNSSDAILVSIATAPAGGFFFKTAIGRLIATAFGLGTFAADPDDPLNALGVGGSGVRSAGAVAGIVKEVNLSRRIAESGMNLRQAGEFFGWGNRQINKPLSAFTRESLEAAGWNSQRLSNVANGYERLAAATRNPSAALRAEQLRNLNKLFGD